VVTSIEERQQLDRFAQAAAEDFRQHPEHWTFSDAEIHPLLLGIRWAADNTAVLVCRLDEYFRPLVYGDLLPTMRREHGHSAALWSFEMLEAISGLSPAQLADELDDLLLRVLRVFIRMIGIDAGPGRIITDEIATSAASTVRRVLGTEELPIDEEYPDRSWMPRARIFDLAGGGALVCREPIPGVTHEMTGEEALYYTRQGLGLHFVAESMSRSTARAMASSLGGVLADEITEIARRAGVALLPLPPYEPDSGEIPSYLTRHPELAEEARELAEEAREQGADL